MLSVVTQFAESGIDVETAKPTVVTTPESISIQKIKASLALPGNQAEKTILVERLVDEIYGAEILNVDEALTEEALDLILRTHHVFSSIYFVAAADDPLVKKLKEHQELVADCSTPDPDAMIEKYHVDPGISQAPEGQKILDWRKLYSDLQRLHKSGMEDTILLIFNKVVEVFDGVYFNEAVTDVEIHWLAHQGRQFKTIEFHPDCNITIEKLMGFLSTQIVATFLRLPDEMICKTLGILHIVSGLKPLLIFSQLYKLYQKLHAVCPAMARLFLTDALQVFESICFDKTLDKKMLELLESGSPQFKGIFFESNIVDIKAEDLCRYLDSQESLKILYLPPGRISGIWDLNLDSLAGILDFDAWTTLGMPSDLLIEMISSMPLVTKIKLPYCRDPSILTDLADRPLEVLGVIAPSTTYGSAFKDLLEAKKATLSSLYIGRDPSLRVELFSDSDTVQNLVLVDSSFAEGTTLEAVVSRYPRLKNLTVGGCYKKVELEPVTDAVLSKDPITRADVEALLAVHPGLKVSFEEAH